MASTRCFPGGTNQAGISCFNSGYYPDKSSPREEKCLPVLELIIYSLYPLNSWPCLTHAVFPAVFGTAFAPSRCFTEWSFLKEKFCSKLKYSTEFPFLFATHSENCGYIWLSAHIHQQHLPTQWYFSQSEA